MTLQHATQVSILLLAVGLGALAGMGGPTAGEPAHAQAEQALAVLYTDAGVSVGVVAFTQEEDAVLVRADVANLPPGFHGFHVHTSGVCDAATNFTSAGGHLDHGVGRLPDGGLPGDLPNLYVQADGTGMLSFRHDRFPVAALLADSGRAVVVHAGPDNFRNIPGRYGVTVDQSTLDTGDAGARIACGVIRAS